MSDDILSYSSDKQNIVSGVPLPEDQEPQIIDVEPKREGDEAAPLSEERSVVRGSPFLQDLPVIGMFFSSKDFEEKAMEVIFILTPSISSGGIEFMRPWVQRVYGIPPEQVVGSSVKTVYEVKDGVVSLAALSGLPVFWVSWR